MSQLSTCCLANPTHFCTPLISFDHYCPRLWPKLDAAWLIIWQSAANYPAVARQRDKRERERNLLPPSDRDHREGRDQVGWFHLRSDTGSSREAGRNEAECKTQPDSRKPWLHNKLGKKKKEKHEAWCSAWFSSDENYFHHSPDGRRTPQTEPADRNTHCVVSQPNKWLEDLA